MKGRRACSLFGIYWELLTKTICLQWTFGRFSIPDFIVDGNNTDSSNDYN